jgi:hypothetical protein
MAGLKIYRILTYILFPFALLLVFNIIQTLPISFGVPLLLLSNFILACLPIYIFASSYFLLFGVFKAKSCKHSLKDWIKVNAYVAIVFSVFMIIGCLAILMALNNPVLLAELTSKLNTQGMPGVTKQNNTQLLQLFKMSVYIMLPFSIALLAHIVFTFKAIKLYAHVFDEA